MASKGKQKIHATEGREEIAGKRFNEIRELIMQNTSEPFKNVITKIAGITVGTFYNYIYPGKQYGRVSLYTVENLGNYFALPVGIFDCTIDFTQEAKEKISLKIRQDFSTSNVLSETAPQEEINQIHDDSDIIETIKRLAISIGNESNITMLEQVIPSLESLQEIARSRHSTLYSINKLQR